MTELPASLRANPLLSRWISFDPDGTVAMRTGKVELGQGILTALAQIAAEELDVDVARVRVVAADTATGPDEGLTAGSLSVQQSGAALRQACAQIRARAVDLAATTLGVPADELAVRDGEIRAPDGRYASYWTLAGCADATAGAAVPTKAPSAYSVVGRSVARLDLADKVTGYPRFIHDLALPGLCHGRMVRSTSPGARLTALDDAAARRLPGVLAVLRDGDLAGVVAEREEVAVRAAEVLAAGARWEDATPLPDERELAAFLMSAPAETTVLADTPGGGGVRTLTATYHRGYLAHASMAPSCALARDDGSSLEIWTHSQGVYPLRGALAEALGREPERIVVRHVEGAGCYGHNGADDVALDAALLAALVPGRPVRVVWSRADELTRAPFGPAGVVRLTAGVDARGDLRTWRTEIWSNGHSGRPASLGAAGLLAHGQRSGASAAPASTDVPLARGGGAARNAVPGYDVPALRVVYHRLLAMPLRTSALRSLGAHLNVFALESFVDELAEACGDDPVGYRLRHLSDPRARDVIAAALERDGGGSWWGDGEGEGRGLAYARYKNTGAYCAVVARVRADREVRVLRLTLAVDAGLVVNPDGAANQIEGGAIQATSWTLKERVRFDRYRVRGDSWEEYPILRFTEVPDVDVVLLDRPGLPSLGVGEAAAGPTAAAIANAVYRAIGVRVRELPLTPDRVVAAMEG